jgi:hypothetical protein
MATASFAVGSVSVAIVWGTFFYPPPAKHALSAPAMASQTQRAAPVITPPEAPPKAAPLPKQHPALALNGQSLAISKP